MFINFFPHNLTSWTNRFARPTLGTFKACTTNGKTCGTTFESLLQYDRVQKSRVERFRNERRAVRIRRMEIVCEKRSYVFLCLSKSVDFRHFTRFVNSTGKNCYYWHVPISLWHAYGETWSVCGTKNVFRLELYNTIGRGEVEHCPRRPFVFIVFVTTERWCRQCFTRTIWGRQNTRRRPPLLKYPFVTPPSTDDGVRW